VGDVVEVGGLLGEVQKIGTRASTIRTYEGAEVIVPNATLITDKLINWTLSEQRRRVDIKVGVAYGTDTQRVMDILRLATAGHRQIFAEPEPVVLFTGFGESSLDFELRVWTDFQDHVVVRSDLNMAVNQALAKAGIEIPFPQRDLHIRSAVAAPVQFSPAAPGDDSSTS
jgi:small-conductance mechanosensitive channel